MKQSVVRKLGEKNIIDTKINDDIISYWRKVLFEYEFEKAMHHDSYAWLACTLSLKTVSLGNLGIGCLLVDNANEIVVQGYNQVFQPYFKSSAHAEMVVMDKFEEINKEINSLKNYRLFTSLEPCPMCLTRLITSGVEEVYYVAADELGGMVHLKKENLPPIWNELSVGQHFKEAKCSQKLKKHSFDIFNINRKKLDGIIKSRRGY